MIGRPHALFVCDLDGTLLAPDRTLPASNRAAIERATADGCAVAVVTGRRLTGVMMAYDQLDGLDLTIATSNGAVVLGSDRRSAIWVHPLDWAIVDEVASDDTLAEATIFCVTAPDESIPTDCLILERVSRRPMTSETAYRRDTWQAADVAAFRARPLVHVAVHLPTRAAADDAVVRLARRLPASVSVHSVVAPVGSGALAEIVPSGGKGNALHHLRDELAIAPESTGAIGDELNDRDLLLAATHRYTVGGSILAERMPGATVVAHASDGAVADALERFLAGRDSTR